MRIRGRSGNPDRRRSRRNASGASAPGGTWGPSKSRDLTKLFRYSESPSIHHSRYRTAPAWRNPFGTKSASQDMLGSAAGGQPIGESMKHANFNATASRRCVRRRDVLSLMAGAATWTTSLYAQKLAMPVIGYLCAESPELFATRLKAFHEGLGETGFVEGRNVAIDYQWAEGQYARLPALAATWLPAMSTSSSRPAARRWRSRRKLRSRIM